MATALNGNCEIYYESFGDPADPTLLLVNGLGSQCINYHEDWCAKFVSHGMRVVRFDNRDVGLSSKFDDAPVGANGEAYNLSDMAADAVAVLDAIGVERAHVMGLSMGGMIVQTMAIEHPDRLLSMTSVMSRTGEPGYGESTPEAFALLTAPPATDRESFVEAQIAGLHMWGSPEFADEDRTRRVAERAYDRCFHPMGTARQYRAVLAGPPRAERLARRDDTVVGHSRRPRHPHRHQWRPTYGRVDSGRTIRSHRRAGSRLPAAAVGSMGRAGDLVRRDDGIEPALVEDRHHAVVAVDAQPHTGLDRLGGERSACHRRQPVLAAHDCCVAHHAARVGDDGRDPPEDRRPRRGGDGCDEDLAILDLRHLLGAGQHAGDAFDDTW